jgi:hypothetical protein
MPEELALLCQALADDLGVTEQGSDDA